MRHDLTLLTDFYQLTMMNGYFKNKKNDKEAVFDLFYRGIGNPYILTCGLEQIIDYVKNINFSEEDIEYLRNLNYFSEEFLEELKKFKFTGDIYAAEEGTIMFPYEPLVVVKARMFEAQFIETAILCLFNHQTLIATKAFKIRNITKKKLLSEFGTRRAQGPDASIYGARAALIAGFNSTSNVLAGKMFNVPISGTHSHSWVMSFNSELEAFRKYAEIYPDKCILLVDTYDTLKSGIPNAITVFKELKEKGYKPIGIRLDSGDLAYLTKEARKMLDKEGFEDVSIVVSNDLDENIIASLDLQGAKIDAYGIGTKLITGGEVSSLGGVYKLAAIEKENGVFEPKMKFSNSPEKITNPGFKQVVRFVDKTTGKAKADLICLFDEDFSNLEELEIYHPIYTFKRKTLTNFTVRKLLIPIFKNGELVYKVPSIKKIKENVKKSENEIWEEYKRQINPDVYKVDLSDKLWNLKTELLSKKNDNINKFF